MLPKIAEGDNATTWIIPAELTKALGTLGGTFGKIPVDGGGSKTRIDFDEPMPRRRRLRRWACTRW